MGGVGDPTDIRVTPAQRRELEDIFGAERVKVTIDDLEGLLDRVQQKDTKAKGAKWAVNEYHEEYHTIEEVMEFIYQLESDYSELVTVSKIGESYEGRDLLMACLS